MSTTIRFFNTEGNEDGSVVIANDGTMRGSDENMQLFADHWRKGGSSPQKFIETFSNWGNGYSSAKADD